MDKAALPFLSVSLILLLTCGACGSRGDAGKPEAQTDAPEAALSPDSLRKAYQYFIQKRQDLLPAQAIKEEGKLYPIDEAPLDSSFFVFREQLLEGVERRNIFTVMEAVDENIKNGFGGNDGIAAFATQWELESEEKAKNSTLWEVLGKVLRGGGAFQEGRRRFVAPYVYANWPEEVDAFTHVAITGAGVRLRESPGLNTPILTMVNNDIVQSLGQTEETETVDGESHPWIHIKTSSGAEGYVWGKFVASPIGYRAGFEKRNGQWRMVFLLAGD